MQAYVISDRLINNVLNFKYFNKYEKLIIQRSFFLPAIYISLLRIIIYSFLCHKTNTLTLYYNFITTKCVSCLLTQNKTKLIKRFILSLSIHLSASRQMLLETRYFQRKRGINKKKTSPDCCRYVFRSSVIIYNIFRARIFFSLVPMGATRRQVSFGRRPPFVRGYVCVDTNGRVRQVNGNFKCTQR